MLNKYPFIPPQIKQNWSFSRVYNAHGVYYVLDILKELQMDLLEAPVLHRPQTPCEIAC